MKEKKYFFAAVLWKYIPWETIYAHKVFAALFTLSSNLKVNSDLQSFIVALRSFCYNCMLFIPLKHGKTTY